MDEDIVDYALDCAMKKKIEYAEVRGSSQIADGIMLRNGSLEAYATAVDSGLCVRIMAGGGIGFASTNKWSKEEARTITDLAFRYAKAARRKDKLSFARRKRRQGEMDCRTEKENRKHPNRRQG